MYLTILMMILIIVSCSTTTKTLKSPAATIHSPTLTASTSPCTNIRYEDFIKPIEKIERQYIRERAKFVQSGQEGSYVYEIFPMTQYPFFYIPGQQKPDLNFCPIYSEKYISIFYCKDSTIHIQFAFLQYIKTKIDPPRYKTFKLYSLQFNNKSKEWEEEKSPQTSILTWSQKNQQYFVKKY